MKRKKLYVITSHPDNISCDMMYMCGLRNTWVSCHSTLLGVKDEMIQALQDDDAIIKSIVTKDINDHSFIITFEYIDRPDIRYICDYVEMEDTHDRSNVCNVFIEMDTHFGPYVTGKIMITRHHSKSNMC